MKMMHIEKNSCIHNDLLFLLFMSQTYATPKAKKFRMRCIFVQKNTSTPCKRLIFTVLQVKLSCVVCWRLFEMFFETFGKILRILKAYLITYLRDINLTQF